MAKAAIKMVDFTFKIYEVRKGNNMPPKAKIPDEVYLINEEGETEKLDWGCPIEVARLAGLEIVEEEHNGVERYFLRRIPYRFK